MAKTLTKSKLAELKGQLEAEQVRLAELIEEHEQEMEEARLTETAADRSPDPGNAEAGSMKFEYEKELSMQQNSLDLLRKVEHALKRIEAGTYGLCESCSEPIPVARLDALPYATFCVNCASKR